MSDTLNILKGIKLLFKRGETFYYANRNTKQEEKCTVVDWVCQYPMAYIAKNEASVETFKCYHDFGCFASEQEAYDDAQIEADRIILICPILCDDLQIMR